MAYDLAERNGLKHHFNSEKQMAGRYWFSGFLKRHPNLSIRAAETTSINRLTAFNQTEVQRFFELLQNLYNKYNYGGKQIFNVDESGITTVQKNEKVIARKGQKIVGRISSAERGRLVTVICCMSAVGDYIPPMMVFARKRSNADLIKDAPFGTILGISNNGWSTSECFFTWMKHFKEYANPSEDNPVLLILDNHDTHINLELIEYCNTNHIEILSIPPHTSHRLQPLDISFFGPFKKRMNKCISSYLNDEKGERLLEKDISKVFCRAYIESATMATAVNGFRAAGIAPLKKDIFTEADFIQNQMFEPHQKGISGAEPSAVPSTSTSMSTAASSEPLENFTLGLVNESNTPGEDMNMERPDEFIECDMDGDSRELEFCSGEDSIFKAVEDQNDLKIPDNGILLEEVVNAEPDSQLLYELQLESTTVTLSNSNGVIPGQQVSPNSQVSGPSSMTWVCVSAHAPKYV